MRTFLDRQSLVCKPEKKSIWSQITRQLSGMAGFKICEGPQFWAAPVVPFDHTMIDLTSFGAGPTGATTNPVEMVFLTITSDEI